MNMLAAGFASIRSLSQLFDSRHSCLNDWLLAPFRRQQTTFRTPPILPVRASADLQCAFVSRTVICVSANVRRARLSVSANVRRNPLFIARPGDHHCRPLQLLPHIAPLGWQHINLTGDYLWSDPATLDGDGYRQLRRFNALETAPA
jgi:hypothetical protein